MHLDNLDALMRTQIQSLIDTVKNNDIIFTEAAAILERFMKWKLAASPFTLIAFNLRISSRYFFVYLDVCLLYDKNSLYILAFRSIKVQKITTQSWNDLSSLESLTVILLLDFKSEMKLAISSEIETTNFILEEFILILWIDSGKTSLSFMTLAKNICRWLHFVFCGLTSDYLTLYFSNIQVFSAFNGKRFLFH